ncbi:MAG: hypothetical protein JXA09_13295 [Anaerolineae bacterium]|nr:hypothetical protein [Anaerolineae bacterium]
MHRGVQRRNWLRIWISLVVVAGALISPGAQVGAFLAEEAGEHAALEVGPGEPSPVRAMELARPSLQPNAAGSAMHWSIEMVDDVGAPGQYSSLAIDASGALHASYYDAGGTALRYAVNDGSGWVTETVDNSGDVGAYTSLALDGKGIPRIAYYDATDGIGKPKYAQYTGSAWISETLDSSDDAGSYLSLAIDRKGNPHLSYMDDGAGGLLRYATRSGAWQYTIVDGSYGVMGPTSLALLDGLYPRIAYYNFYTNTLSYAFLDGTWKVAQVTGPDGGGAAPSLALDASGRPHMSYSKGSDFRHLYYATHDGHKWVTASVDETGDIGTFTSIALDGSGRPCIAYYDGLSGTVRYAYRGESGWTSEVVAQDVGMDAHPALAMDPQGLPHITYWHDDQGLKHAWLGPCVAPQVVDLAGPATLLVGDEQRFTATVSPLTATLPITYHWQFPGGEHTEVLNAYASSLYVWAPVTGTHTVTVSARNCGGERTTTREVTVEAPALPDLVVADLWHEGTEVWVQIVNTGAFTAEAGHAISVTADGATVGLRRIYDDLAPGQRWTGALDSAWACTGSGDRVQATADGGQALAESD